MIRTYTELMSLPTFEERFQYLKLDGEVGHSTFGYDRYLNQQFYKSDEWKQLRRRIILRDRGRDLGMKGYDIRGRIIVHHMNPITVEDILNRSEFLLDPEYLICTAHLTHEAITYGSEEILISAPIERSRYDTCPWRQN